MLIDTKKNILNTQKKIKKLHNLYDYIIIGSGPASSVILNNLLKTGKKILVVERGEFKKKSKKSVQSNHFKIREESRVFGVGGTSNTWSQVYSLISKNEMCNNKKRNIWPINHRSLINWCHKVGPKYKFNIDKIGEEKIYKNKFYTRKFIEVKKPLRFDKYFKKKGFDLIINCQVKTIDEKKKYNTIFFDLNFQTYSINAKKIIICAGAIESTLLIINSIRNNKLRNIKNKKFLGRYFMDHPKCYVGEIKFFKKKIIDSFKVKYKKKFNIYTGLSLFQKNIKSLNTYIRFEEKKSFIGLKKKTMIRIFLEMEPKFNNRIYLKNNLGIVNISISQKEIEISKKLLKEVISYFSEKPTKENLNFSKKNLVDASHHMGGMIYPKIVDKNLKIQGIKNIFCCSSAIFPTSGSVNPTLIICALAERLNKFLQNK